jgi:hypothetical protein
MFKHDVYILNEHWRSRLGNVIFSKFVKIEFRMVDSEKLSTYFLSFEDKIPANAQESKKTMSGKR